MFNKKFALILFAFIKMQVVLAQQEKPYHNTNFLPNHTGIVQMFQWPYNSIAKECEAFLGPKGFAAVEVSPVHENHIIPGRPWFEVYQLISYKIINRLGDESEFAEMVKRCNNSGVRVIVDVVLNHMSGEGETSIIKGAGRSLAAPKIKLYPAVPYSILDFHKQCTITDESNKTQVRNCELSQSPDLDQSNLNVRIQTSKMMNKLIKLGVAGFRMDSADYMDPNDLKVIYDRLDNLNTKFGFSSDSRPFIYQVTKKWKQDYVDIGKILESEYAYALAKVMRGEVPLQRFVENDENSGFVQNADAVVDIDNHDNQRTLKLLTYREPKQLQMATAFMLAFPYGTPKILSSYSYENADDGPPSDSHENILAPSPDEFGKCSGNWNCEHRYEAIANMVEFANIVRNEEFKSLWSNENRQASFCRGNKGFMAFNAGNSSMNVELDTCLEPGTYCDLATGKIESDECSWKKSCSGREIVVNQNGKAQIVIDANEDQQFVAIHVNSKIGS